MREGTSRRRRTDSRREERRTPARDDLFGVAPRGGALGTTPSPPSFPVGSYPDEQIQALAGWWYAIRAISEMGEEGLFGAFESVCEILRSLEPALERHAHSELIEISRRIRTAKAEEVPKLLSILIRGLRRVIDERSRNPVSILVLNAGAGRVEEIEAMLAGPRRQIRIAFSVDEAAQAMESDSPDLLVIRLEAHDAESRTFLISLLSRPENVVAPTIVLISDTDPALRAECLALGADAVLMMPGDAGICSTAAAAMLRRRAALERMAQEDYLTGLPNRAALARIFRQLQSLARRNNEPLTLAILDLDVLKEVNDRLGHTAGDLLLRRLARVVRSTLRASDVLARWGGDEFVVLLPRTEAAGAAEGLDKARRNFREAAPRRLGVSKKVRKPSFSAGITNVRYDESVENAVSRADRLLYRAKQAGRDRVMVEDPDRPGVLLEE